MSSTPERADAPAPMHRAGVGRLLLPKWLTARTRGRMRDPRARGRVIGLVLFGTLFWTGTFLVLRRMLRFFANAPDLGPLLAAKLLGLIFVGFFSILLLSNVITALSTFFLARDLDLLAAAPVRWPALYATKLIETVVSSSWMVGLLAIPMLAAYGVVFAGGAAFPLVALAVLVPYFVLPAALGSTATLLLVNIFPARRTRDILSVVTVCAGAAVVVALRLIRPERLARPEGFQSVTAYLVSLQTPAATWLPSEWASRAIMTWLRGGWQTLDGGALARLWTAAALAVAAGALAHRAWYTRGYSQSQEGGVGVAATRGGGSARASLARRAGRALVAPLGVERRTLLAKEIKVFFRDATQWSQLVLLAVLVIVYVFNIRFLPLTDDRVGVFLRNVIPFCNIMIAGFVLASIAARFIFPAVSLEGRTLWLLRSSPLRVRDLLWAKYWVGTFPLLVLAVGIVVATNVLLEVNSFMFAVSLFTVVLLTLALAALALCFGTLFPRFETENPAQIPTSLGGLIFMMTAVLLICAVIVAEARPVYLVLIRHALRSHAGGRSEMVGGFALATALCVGATLVPIGIALRRLEATERAG
jgi:ABC-2 type transport system permease protein